MAQKHYLVAGIAFFLASAASTGVHGQQEGDWRKTPWIEPQDTTMGTFQPDEYAWRLFVALNWPAKAGGCGPDTNKKLGDPGRRVWEQWALKTDVFLANAKKPAEWTTLCGGAPEGKRFTPNSEKAAVMEQLAASKPVGMKFVPPEGDLSTTEDEEVRMNESSFRFIRDNNLYDRDVLKALAASGQKTLDFPLQAKEIKAHWARLTDPADYTRYFTAKTADGKVYGLVAFHIITKDMPRWFWATFEHVDNETRWPKQHPAEFAGWVVPPHDAYACPGKPTSCNAAPKGIGLEGTAWANYRLKASQTDWVDSFGEPTRVVNSKIESGFIQTKSSCISCHALAVIGAKTPANTNTFMPFKIFKADDVDDDGRVANFIGVVGQADRIPNVGTDPKDAFMQLDFVWSLRNAKSK